MRGIKQIIGMLAFAIPAGHAWSQPSATIEPDPLYRVEIIVFSYNDANRGEEDFFHAAADEPNLHAPPLLRLPGLALESLSESGPAAPGAADSPTGAALPERPAPGNTGAQAAEQLGHIEPFGDTARAPGSTPFDEVGAIPDRFRVLSSDELELGDVRARLERARPYHVLGHVGWEQTGVDIDRAVSLDLARLGITNPRGTIELYLRRFLHVIVDLDYTDGRGTFWSAPEGFGLAPVRYAETYHLRTEEDAIRRGDLHYIDHPLFGMLIRVTAAPEDESDAGEAGGPAA